jgi:GxxExxY protein
MHVLYDKAHKLSGEVIGAAIEVHQIIGPGLLESIYERCLVHELSLRGIHGRRQIPVTITYKDMTFEDELRVDILAEDCLLIELKAVEKVLPIHKAQLLSYMKLLDIPLGLLINFHEIKLVDGVNRMLLSGADKQKEG